MLSRAYRGDFRQHMSVIARADDLSGEIFDSANISEEQKKELLRKKNNLTIAIYEYYFANKPGKKENILRSQFDGAVAVLEKLITDGVESGEFYCEDARGCARNIMYVLEGLKVSAHTMGITEKMVDDELLYIMQGLVVEE